MEESTASHPAIARPLPFDRLGPYEIRGVLGSGGLGTVYRAWDERLGREVALKVLGEGLEGSLSSLADLEREARILAALSHANILGIFDVGEDHGRRWVATELLAGVNLRDRMDGRPLPWRTAVAIALEAAKGLAAAHAAGIVHLDLKPENIFVLAHGGVKILDFGLARRESELLAAHARSDQAGAKKYHQVAGTVAYLTPEQLGGAPVDQRTDIFALGTVLFEALTGRLPFKRDTVVATFEAIAHEEPSAITAPGLTIPDGLGRIVRRCLHKDPRKRFQTALDLAFALSEQLAMPAPTPPRRPEWPIRLAWFLAGAAAAAAGFLLLDLV